MNLPGEKQATYIDCHQAEFTATDPQSAAHYAKLLTAIFEFEVPAFAESTPFFAKWEVCRLPDVTVSRAKSAASRFTRTRKMLAKWGTDQILVVCYTSGHFTMTAAGKTRRVEAGELAFIDLSQEIVIEAPAVENLSLAVSRRKLETMVPFLDDAHCFVREQSPLSHVLRRTIEEIMIIGPTMPIIDARAIADATIQLVASCLVPLSRQQVETNFGRSTVSLVAIKAAIEQRLSDPELRPQTLLDEFGITRSTLYRLFEPLGGVSAYITERRLYYAFRLMADTAQPRRRISPLAFELGFSHPSAFSRAFKDFFGMSPKDVQALADHSKEQEVQLLVSPDLQHYLSPIAREDADPIA